MYLKEKVVRFSKQHRKTVTDWQTAFMSSLVGGTFTLLGPFNVVLSYELRLLWPLVVIAFLLIWLLLGIGFIYYNARFLVFAILFPLLVSVLPGFIGVNVIVFVRDPNYSPLAFVFVDFCLWASEAMFNIACYYCLVVSLVGWICFAYEVKQNGSNVITR